MDKINRRNGTIMVTITNFLADPPWVVYILGELCYTKTTIAAQFAEKTGECCRQCAGVADKSGSGFNW